MRLATLTDARSIAALHIASWKTAYRGILPNEFLDAQSLEERTCHWDEYLRDAVGAILVWEDDFGLLGFCATGPSRDPDRSAEQVWEIYNLHVAPDARGNGVGTLLLESATSLGRDRGRGQLTLWVAERNWSARRFYEKHGLRPDGSHQRHLVGVDVYLPEVRYAGEIAVKPGA